MKKNLFRSLAAAALAVVMTASARAVDSKPATTPSAAPATTPAAPPAQHAGEKLTTPPTGLQQAAPVVRYRNGNWFTRRRQAEGAWYGPTRPGRWFRSW